MKVDNLTLNCRKVLYISFCFQNFKDKLIEIIEKIPGFLFNQSKK